MNAVKKRFVSGGSGNMSPKKKTSEQAITKGSDTYDGLSPELIPIVTLLSSQSHRRYHEGIFMLYYDLNGDGKPAEREWKEVYGILTGNQLAYWDAANLAEFRNNPELLFELSSKPNYINFTDSVYNAMKTLPAAKQNLDNVIVVSTTLKNRYIIQFKTYRDLTTWYLALRLANYEYSSLQEAYTGALLSARGSRLSDIRTILAEKRFDHEDWVSIRYGSGMAWKRCYAVIEPSTTKKKTFNPGRVLLYENDQKKKKQLLAVVINASSVTAIYPQSHQLIDHSTMLKIEAFINYKTPSISPKVSKKETSDYNPTSIFLIPEQHSAVPGFDTLIRCLIPLLDSFGLYGRPRRLKADRVDPESLLFGLPTLPHVHYLDISDINNLSSNSSILTWTDKEWIANLKGIMKSKLDRGYEGCGSIRGVAGAVSSLASPTPSNTSTFKPNQDSARSQNNSSEEAALREPKAGLNKSGLLINIVNSNEISNSKTSPITSKQQSNTNNMQAGHHKSVELSEIYHKYSKIKSPSDQFHTNRTNLLNGSAEDLVEDDLPAGVRKITLEETGIYPKNDEDLFDDDNNSEDASDEYDDDNDDNSFDAGQPGSNDDLVVPRYNVRNSSYSSVHSPMTQYHEFNKQFNKSVDNEQYQSPIKNTASEVTNDANYNSSSPYKNQLSSQIAKSKPSYNLSESISTVSHGVTTPKTEHPSVDYLSIHSESGKVVSDDSSHNSQLSAEDTMRQQTQQIESNAAPIPHKPRYISSPNTSQNQAHKFSSPEGKKHKNFNLTGGIEQPSNQSAYKSQFPIQQGMGRPSQPFQHNYKTAPPPGQSFVPQMPPQQKEYPQSQQFGYAKQPPPNQQYRPQPQPQPPSQPQFGSQQYRPPPISQQAPSADQFGNQSTYAQKNSLYRSHQNQPTSMGQQQRVQPIIPQSTAQGPPPPQQQQQQQQQRYYQTGIPPSVSYQNQPNRPQQQGQQMQRPQNSYPPQSSQSLRAYNAPNQQQYHQVNPSNQQAQQYAQQRQQQRPPQQTQQNGGYPENTFRRY